MNTIFNPWSILVPSTGFPSPAYLPSRARHGTNLWNVYSHRLKREVFLYTDLEYDHWVLVESSWVIPWYCEQYPKVALKINGNRVSTIYDMLICHSDKTLELREVKYLLDCSNNINDRTRVQLYAQKSWAKKVGLSYSIMTEVEIRSNPIYLANWRKILGYLSQKEDEEFQHKIIKYISMVDSCDIRDICNYFDLEKQTVISNIFFLLHKGFLTARLDTEILSPNIKIEINNAAK